MLLRILVRGKIEMVSRVNITLNAVLNLMPTRLHMLSTFHLVCSRIDSIGKDVRRNEETARGQPRAV